MGIAFDVDFDVTFSISSRCANITIMVGMADYSLGDKRSSIPQFGSVCMAANIHPSYGLYHHAILDVPTRIPLLGT